MNTPAPRRLRLRVWSPLPPSPSGIADYTLEQIQALRRHAEITAVVENPMAVEPAIRDVFPVVEPSRLPAADLDLYHLGNSPSHAYVYRAAIAAPGVAVLHEWNLHHLVLFETVEQGNRTRYLREMRRAYGETGTFVGRQMARALGGDVLAPRFPLNERILERSLAVVGLTRHITAKAAAAMPGRPVLHVPHHLSLPLEPSRADARRALGIAADELVVTAPGLATRAKCLEPALAALSKLAPEFPRLRFFAAGEVDRDFPLANLVAGSPLAERSRIAGRVSLADFVRHLAAADVILSLRYPSFGEMSGALVRSLGLGRTTLVTAGTPGAEEFPPGIVVPIRPGRSQAAEIEAVLRYLLADPAARAALGAAAREFVRREHDLVATTAKLAAFLAAVDARKAELRAGMSEEDEAHAPLARFFDDEIRWAARDLNLRGYPLGIGALLDELSAGS